VILVGDRRPEQRHDPVAHDLIDRALVAVDGLHHPFEHGVEELPGFFRILVGQQLHRPFQVREQDRDLLALPFEGTLGGEDLLGEVLGGVGLGGVESRPRHRVRGLGSAEPLTTLLAELGAELIRGAATRARSFEPSPTLLTEDGIAGVLVLAADTRHGRGRVLPFCSPRFSPSSRTGRVKVNVDP
jgi:hypothetical protein